MERQCRRCRNRFDISTMVKDPKHGWVCKEECSWSDNKKIAKLRKETKTMTDNAVTVTDAAVQIWNFEILIGLLSHYKPKSDVIEAEDIESMFEAVKAKYKEFDSFECTSAWTNYKGYKIGIGENQGKTALDLYTVWDIVSLEDGTLLQSDNQRIDRPFTPETFKEAAELAMSRVDNKILQDSAIEDENGDLVVELEFNEDDVIAEQQEMTYKFIEANYKKKYNEALKLVAKQQTLIEQLTATQDYTPRPINVKLKKGQDSTAAAILQLSDLHIGSIIDGHYVKGSGFNPKMAAVFLKQITEATISFIRERQSSVAVDELVVLLGGDLIEVIDHGQAQIEVMDQVILCQDLIAQVFKDLLVLGIPITCHVVSGNHDRLTKYKRVPTDNRMRRSFDWVIANNLMRVFPEIVFNIEESYLCKFDVKGFKCLLHHGDAIRGGTGVGGIAPSLMKWHYRQDKFDLAFMGHFHTNMVFNLNNGYIITNGCLSGDSGYTQILGLRSDRSQNLIFVDSKHGYNALHRISVG